MVALLDVRRPAGGLGVGLRRRIRVRVELEQVPADGMPAVPLAEHVAQRVGLAQAGGGIVFDSDPATEWEETMNKGRALFRAVAQAASGL